MTNKRLPQEDMWTFQEVGTPFPPHAVKAVGNANMYVALCYKHGKPIMGMAWNDSGVVQCSFAINASVQTGKEIGGTIQLLTYSLTHTEVGFYYDWLPYNKWKQEEGNDLCAVRCGQSVPVYLPDKLSLGHLEISDHRANMQIGHKVEMLTESHPLMPKLMVLCRVTKGGPPHCQCAVCSLAKVKNRPPLMVNDWADYKEGDRMPADKPVCRALGRTLNTPCGKQDQFVALWYRHGKPVMGRAWSEHGIIRASFVGSGREFTGRTVGSLQLLIELPAEAAGFDYTWLPYEQASKHDGKDYAPVHMSYVAPCVMLINGAELLGGIDLKSERAEGVVNGKVIAFEGGQLNKFLILCRIDRDDTMTI